MRDVERCGFFNKHIAPMVSSFRDLPQGLDVGAIRSLPGVEEVRIITTGMLWFKALPAPGAPTAGVELDMRATAVKEASKTVPVGSVSLFNEPTTSRSIFSLFPNN